ncbi:MAG: hypothetical protein HY587_05575 [Candidatus Omnitrophica bacterium]|nr:hypothetical protein [Candidatus Omnitrophota bacterium]
MSKNSDDGLIRGPFPGDQKSPIGKNWKPLIFIVPPFPIAGICWLFGIREPFAVIMVTLLCSAVFSALLYYLFFAESDYFTGTMRNLFRRRQ